MAIEITEEQLFDYMNCPLRYDARYRLKAVTKNHPSMNTLLNRVANSFLLALMNGVVLPTSQLKKKWDKICEENRDIISQKKCIEGISDLIKMFQWAEDKQLRVSDVQIPYSYLSSDKNIIVSGIVRGAAIPMEKGKYELLELDFSSKYPDQAMLDMRLKTTLDWFACQRIYRNNELAGVHVHHVKSNRDWFTYRGADEKARLDASVLGIVTGVQQKIFYPRESAFCSSCDMKNYCRMWRGVK